MPPAFNLSQDQTLQFNPKTRRNLSDEIPFPQTLKPRRRTSTLDTVQALLSILKASARRPNQPCGQPKHPRAKPSTQVQALTPIGCRFLKNDFGEPKSRALYSPKSVGQALQQGICGGAKTRTTALTGHRELIRTEKDQQRGTFVDATPALVEPRRQ